MYLSKSVGASPHAKSLSVSRSMKSNKASGTNPEVVLSMHLKKRLVKSDLPGSPDFVYPKARLAVFVHGCFWHRCPVHSRKIPRTHEAFWKRKFARNIERDRLNRDELESMGWKVMEIWEHEVKADPRGCAERIRAEVRTRGRVRAHD